MSAEPNLFAQRDADLGLRAHRIGEILVAKGVVSEDQVRIALTEQNRNEQKKSRREQLGKILVRLGFVTEAVLNDVLGGALGYDCVDLSKVIIDNEAVRLVPKDIARRYRILALTLDQVGGLLTVATADPFNVIALDQVRALFGSDVEVRTLVAGEADLSKAIDQFYGFELSVDGILQEIETGEVDYQSLEAESDEYSQPIVRLVNALLSDAVKRGASDIHFEPEHDFLRIRYRVDGVLRQIRSLHRNYWSALAVRIKVMAGVNIAEMRAPQDGRISLTVSGHPVDFRVSTLPTTHGENIVLRVLDRHKGIMTLEQLGLQPSSLGALRLMMARPQGIILITGPTGSGKTTTLYSMLNCVNSESVNIMTLEDPVEYPMEMIRQSSVNEAIKLDFGNGVRAMMRQDPDIILVGEIRDADTAEMAFRAAMTGHQVYSTLHTNSAIGAIPRLLDTGIRAEIMAGNIVGIMAQRLARRLCANCRKPYEPSPVERRLLGLPAQNEVAPIYRANGCLQCEFQGYRGRFALMEVLKIDMELDDMIVRQATMRELLEKAVAKGFLPLAEDGIRRVCSGTTSMDEVSRVLDLTGRLG